LKTSVCLFFEASLVICNSYSPSLYASDTGFLFWCCHFMQLVIALLPLCLFAFWWSSWLFFSWCRLPIFFMSRLWSIDSLLRFRRCLCDSILTVCKYDIDFVADWSGFAVCYWITSSWHCSLLLVFAAEREIKHAIDFSALRKAFKSDDMSFVIMQRAYKSILKIFNLMYLNLIESDYHSKIWREGTEIILKKSKKSNYSISKTYRIIILLNCLDKIAKKLIVMQLSYTAKMNDKLLDFDQMRDRKQRSAINAVLNLVHDAQMTKSRENTLTCLLLNVKDVFDYVTLKQLIKILIQQKILINLINWIKCFLQNWVIDLAFDEERQKSKEIFTEILQESSISLILFLIYIQHLFLKIRARIENLQSLSYIDDVTLYIKKKSIDKNVKKLKKTTKIAFTWANENAMQFNDSKFELIHFESHKAIFDQTIMLLNDTVVKSKICIWWLEVWLNRKLNFKMHMQTKIIAVTRTLHSLFRLMNSEWELNAKSERQLYLACIIIISDYNVEIWWNNQKSHAIKFCKLQNAALRKTLKAFRTSLIKVMQIEAEISSVKVRLDQKCKNYAIRIVELSKKYSTRKWTFILYSSQYISETRRNRIYLEKSRSAKTDSRRYIEYWTKCKKHWIQ